MLLKGETEAVINSCDAHSLRRIKVLNSCIWGLVPCGYEAFYLSCKEP